MADLNLRIQNDKLLPQTSELPVKSDIARTTTLKIQRFTLSNLKPFDQMLEDSSENEELQ
jgi:hypothetical protein